MARGRGKPGDLRFSEHCPKGKMLILDRDACAVSLFGGTLGPPEGPLLIFHDRADYLDWWFAGETWSPGQAAPPPASGGGPSAGQGGA